MYEMSYKGQLWHRIKTFYMHSQYTSMLKWYGTKYDNSQSCYSKCCFLIRLSINCRNRFWKIKTIILCRLNLKFCHLNDLVNCTFCMYMQINKLQSIKQTTSVSFVIDYLCYFLIVIWKIKTTSKLFLHFIEYNFIQIYFILQRYTWHTWTHEYLAT
jgi:hypothetical protein